MNRKSAKHGNSARPLFSTYERGGAFFSHLFRAERQALRLIFLPAALCAALAALQPAAASAAGAEKRAAGCGNLGFLRGRGGGRGVSASPNSAAPAGGGCSRLRTVQTHDGAFDPLSIWARGAAGRHSPDKKRLALTGSGGKTAAPRKPANLAEDAPGADSGEAAGGSRLYAASQNVKTAAGGSGETAPVRRIDDTDTLVLVARSGGAGAPGAPQKLTNLAEGALAADSKEAINGSQLYAANQNIAVNKAAAEKNRADLDGSNKTINRFFGHGADVAANEPPSYTIQGFNANNLGDALNAADSELTKAKTNIKNNTVNIDKNSQSIDANSAAINSANASVSKNRNDFDAALRTTDALIGGGANIANGTAPAITVQGNPYNNIAEALGRVDSGLSSANTQITANKGGIEQNRRNIRNNSDDIDKNRRDIRSTNDFLYSAGINTNSYFGGGADTGQGTAPAYTVQKDVYNNVGDALGKVDSTLNTQNTTIYNARQDIATNANKLSANADDISKNSEEIKRNRNDYDSSVHNTNMFLGGGADIASGAKPTYTVQKGSYNTVGDAFKAIDSVQYSQDGKINDNKEAIDSNAKTIADNKTDADKKIGDISTNITNINEGKIGPVQRAGAGDTLALTAQGRSAESPGKAQKLANLAEGVLGADSKEAINGSQLYAANQNIKSNTDSITAINNNINSGKTGPVQRLNPDEETLTLTDKSGKTAAPQALSNVANGKNGHDAVNFSQLSETNKNVKNNTDSITANKAEAEQTRANLDKTAANASRYLGGGADAAAGKAPVYTIQGKTSGSAGEAFGNVDSALTEHKAQISSNKTKIDNISNSISTGKTGPVQRLSDTELALMDKDGKTAAPQTLSNVANGKNRHDAVNFSQLSETNKNVKNNTDSITAINNNINSGKTGPVQRLNPAEETLALTDKSGKTAAPQKLTNLAEGALAADSKEAINGSQLYAANQANDRRTDENSRQIAQYFGGGAEFKSGAWTGPSYALRSVGADGKITAGKPRNNVGDALSDVSGSIVNVNNRVDSLDKKITDETGKGGENALQWNESRSAYDAGRANKGGKAANKITNIEKGEVSAGSTDAVNGAQLHETNQKLSKMDSRVTNIDGRVTHVENSITEIGKVSQNAVRYDTDSGGKKNGGLTLQGADDSSPVSIHNVADGAVKEKSKDAVNGGQLYQAKADLNAAIDNSAKDTLTKANGYTDRRIANISTDALDRANDYTNRQFSRLSGQLHKARKDARAAAAIGLSAASLRFDDSPGALSVGLGAGYWKDQSALSIGAGYTGDTGKIRTNLTGTLANGALGVGAGLTFRLN